MKVRFTVIFDLRQSICKRTFALDVLFLPAVVHLFFYFSACELDLIHDETIPTIKVTAIYIVSLRADVHRTAHPLNVPKLTRDC